MFVQSNEEEEDGPRDHPQQQTLARQTRRPHLTESVGGGPGPVTSLQLGEHGDQRHVEEDSHCAGQEPGGEVALSPEHQAEKQTEESEY